MNHYMMPRGISRVSVKAFFASLSIVTTMTLAPLVLHDAHADQRAGDATRISQHTQFLIGVPKNTTFQVYSLSKPNRVVVDLPSVDIRLPAQPKNGPVGLVSSFSAGSTGPKRSLIVINVTSPVVVQKAAVTPGKDGRSYFLTLDIEPTGQVTKKTAATTFEKPYGLGAAAVQPPLPRKALTPKQRAAKSAKRIIVIDPGHGGRDSGARKNGVTEKHVVLAFGLALRKILEKTGRYKVLMTRSTDAFITLEGRRKYAERNNAHLFIAVHADYARAGANGATIYSLRDSVAKSLERSAKRRAKRSNQITTGHFAASPATGSDRKVVNGFLADLAHLDVDVTRERSKKFSSAVINFMGGSTNLRASPHKTAAFKVLKTAQVPSVLIELAYVTNKDDAKNLTSKKWRTKVAKSIVTAVDDYFDSDIANLPM